MALASWWVAAHHWRSGVKGWSCWTSVNVEDVLDIYYTGVHVLENHIFWFLGVCNFWRMFFLLIVRVDLRCRWSLLYFMLMFFFCKINHPPSDMSFEFVWEGLHPQKKLVSEISTKHDFQALLQTWQFEYREIQLSVVTISRVFQPLLTCSITICKVFPANNGPPHMDHEAWFVCCYHYHSHCHYYSCIHYPSWKLIAGTGRFDSFSFGGVGGFQA